MSNHTITRNKLLNSLEWVLITILGIFGAWFCWPMLGQYQTKQTSLSQSKTDVQERPTITICFETRHLNGDGLGFPETIDYGSKVRFSLNEDFTIAYSGGIDGKWTLGTSNISK